MSSISTCTPSREVLIDFNDRGKPRPWNQYAGMNNLLGDCFTYAVDILGFTVYEGLADRISNCASYAIFDCCKKEPKRHPKKLKRARFCGNRLCAMCQWRKSLKQFAITSQIFTVLLNDDPSLEFVMLTLTAPNVSLSNLREEINDYSKAWQRLTQRKAVRHFLKGSIRTLEIAYNVERDDWHPHYHSILIFPPSYFSGKYYLSHDKWLDLWRQSKRQLCITNLDVRLIKPKGMKGYRTGCLSKEEKIKMLVPAVAEVCKYAIKPFSDDEEEYKLRKRRRRKKPSLRTIAPEKIYLGSPDLKGHAWVRDTLEESTEVAMELYQQLYGMNMVTYGGLCKEVKKRLKLKDGEDKGSDLIHILEEHKDDCNCSVCGSEMEEREYLYNRLLKYYVGIDSPTLAKRMAKAT